MSSFQDASWRKRTETDKPKEHGTSYPFSNILGDTRNRSRRKRNRFNLIAGAVLALAAIAAILGAN